MPNRSPLRGVSSKLTNQERTLFTGVEKEKRVAAIKEKQIGIGCRVRVLHGERLFRVQEITDAAYLRLGYVEGTVSPLSISEVHPPTK